MSLENLPSHWGFWQNTLNVWDLLIQMWAPTFSRDTAHAGQQPDRSTGQQLPPAALKAEPLISAPRQLWQRNWAQVRQILSQIAWEKGIRDSQELGLLQLRPAISRGSLQNISEGTGNTDGEKSPGVQEFIASPCLKCSDEVSEEKSNFTQLKTSDQHGCSCLMLLHPFPMPILWDQLKAKDNFCSAERAEYQLQTAFLASWKLKFSPSLFSVYSLIFLLLRKKEERNKEFNLELQLISTGQW